jgi:hypothetical protein
MCTVEGGRMKSNISQQIVKLPSLSRQQLLDLWRKVYRRAAPSGIRRELIVPFLAYRMQEKVHGEPSRCSRAELRRIVRNLEKSGGSNESRSGPRIKSGTRLLRQWRGETHEVEVSKLGFEYRGTTYRSLSEIARNITGTRWSGPAFFGIKQRQISSSSDE